MKWKYVCGYSFASAFTISVNKLDKNYGSYPCGKELFDGTEVSQIMDVYNYVSLAQPRYK